MRRVQQVLHCPLAEAVQRDLLRVAARRDKVDSSHQALVALAAQRLADRVGAARRQGVLQQWQGGRGVERVVGRSNSKTGNVVKQAGGRWSVV